jgi:hypothetical protein
MGEEEERLKALRKTMSVSKIARSLNTSEINIARWTKDKKMSEAWRIVIGQRLKDINA